MAKRPLPSPEVLRQLLHCDPTTGRLTWKTRDICWFPGDQSERRWKSWNTKHAGKEALTSPAVGYKAGAVLGVHLLAHRVVWAITFGKWPDRDLDHIDLNRSNNSVTNLREATDAENSFNHPIRSTNTSGFKGVNQMTGYGKPRWVARISANGKRHHLGYFYTPEEAHSAYMNAAARLHKGFARVR